MPNCFVAATLVCASLMVSSAADAQVWGLPVRPRSHPGNAAAIEPTTETIPVAVSSGLCLAVSALMALLAMRRARTTASLRRP